MRFLSIAVEGTIDAAVARRLAADHGFEVLGVHGVEGKQKLDRDLNGYAHSARYEPWLVFRDLDHDAECPAGLIETLQATHISIEPPPQFVFRVAVRAIESWLLADRQGAANWLRVPRKDLRQNPEALDDPKQYLVNLARKSRHREIRDDLVPKEGFSNVVGPGYGSQIRNFVQTRWSPERAAEHSESLRRCRAALDRLRERLTG